MDEVEEMGCDSGENGGSGEWGVHAEVGRVR